jgi:hypothetical protein
MSSVGSELIKLEAIPIAYRDLQFDYVWQRYSQPSSDAVDPNACNTQRSSCLDLAASDFLQLDQVRENCSVGDRSSQALAPIIVLHTRRRTSSCTIAYSTLKPLPYDDIEGRGKQTYQPTIGNKT